MSPYVNSLKVKKIQGQGPYKVDPRFSQVKKVQARDIRSLWLLIGTRFHNIIFFITISKFNKGQHTRYTHV